MIKRLIAILILVATMFSIFGCDAIKKVGGHGEPEIPDNNETAPEKKNYTVYFVIASLLIWAGGITAIILIQKKSDRKALSFLITFIKMQKAKPRSGFIAISSFHAPIFVFQLVQ